MMNTVYVQPKHVAHSTIYKVCCNDGLHVGIIDSKHNGNDRFRIKTMSIKNILILKTAGRGGRN